MGEYLYFIYAILLVRGRVPLTKRIGITTISMPSIFHAQAWREYQSLTRVSFNLFSQMEKMK